MDTCSDMTVVHLSPSQAPYLPMASLYTTHFLTSICKKNKNKMFDHPNYSCKLEVNEWNNNQLSYY